MCQPGLRIMSVGGGSSVPRKRPAIEPIWLALAPALNPEGGELSVEGGGEVVEEVVGFVEDGTREAVGGGQRRLQLVESVSVPEGGGGERVMNMEFIVPSTLEDILKVEAKCRAMLSETMGHLRSANRGGRRNLENTRQGLEKHLVVLGGAAAHLRREQLMAEGRGRGATVGSKAIVGRRNTAERPERGVGSVSESRFSLARGVTETYVVNIKQQILEILEDPRNSNVGSGYIKGVVCSKIRHCLRSILARRSGLPAERGEVLRGWGDSQIQAYANETYSALTELWGDEIESKILGWMREQLP